MKIPYVGSVSKETKKTFIGAVAGSLVVYGEAAANAFVVGYPQILKDQTPPLPRNGALVANLVPLAAAYTVLKRKPQFKQGITVYDLPKLLNQFGYQLAYMMGRPPAAAPARLPFTVRSAMRPPMVNGIAKTPVTPMGGAGKYSLHASSAPTYRAGAGKYRVR